MITLGTKVRYVPHFMNSKIYTAQERRALAVTGIVVSVNEDHCNFTVQPLKGAPLKETFQFFDIGKEVKICGMDRSASNPA